MAEQNLRNHPVGGVETIRPNKFPNLVEVKAGFRVEVVSCHELRCDRRAAALFSWK